MFHDTLPGSSIRLAVEDYDAAFRKIRETGKKLLEDAGTALQDSDNATKQMAIVNTLPGYARREVIALPDGELRVVEVDSGELCGKVSALTPKTAVRGE